MIVSESFKENCIVLYHTWKTIVSHPQQYV